MQQVKVNIQTPNEPGMDFAKKLKKFVFNNIVTILFVILCIIGIQLSKQPMSFIVDELITRIARNSFLVLSLIIPVIAGMGLNFGIVIGAMAGQIAILAVTHWQITGIAGFLLCVVLSTPLSIIFGYATGVLLNKTKGQEMIASMILGFFANGLYQLLFLFLVGTLIPMKNPTLVLSGGIGIKNTVDLAGGIKYAIDALVKVQIFKALVVLAAVFIAYYIYKLFRDRDLQNRPKPKYYFFIGSFVVIGVASFLMINVKSSFIFTTVPVITLAVIAALCIFNIFIVKTKLGQDFRAAGQDMHIANVAGINVNRTRLIAIILSTVLAGWGQLIFLQNIGTLNTYGSHEQVGMFAIAALLIGGASVTKATNSQAIIGTILFHTLFIVSPLAGKNLLGSAQIGEYFRVFVAYGVIGVSLGLHAWKKHVESKQRII
jgi:simple sugar transport system permease protein